MPTPLVLVDLRDGAVIFANRAASRFPEAYDPGADFRDERGEPVPAEALPHAVAARGQTFDHRVLQLQPRNCWLMFHAHVLDGIAMLTFEDVTPLHEAQADLREAVHARDELVSMASHELRSPIGALQLVVEQVCRKAKTKALDDIARLADIGTRQVKRLSVLVGNLLDVSRLRAGRFELDRERCDLAEIVRDACKSLEDQARADGSQLVIDIAGDVIGEWDAMRMEQVVANLVTNALKYGAPPICVRLTKTDATALLVLEDCGPGIPADEHARIFEPFHRASTRRKAQSLGLGLYIVSERVRAHGGTIAVESRAGLTRFSIELPIQ
jgi:signal transduction histidine kinase